MNRHLRLRREVLTPLESDELGQVVGASIDLLLSGGDVCVGNSRLVCVTDTCLTDVNCQYLTKYCLSRFGGAC